MNQIGLVERIEDNIATVFVRRTSACGDNCHTCKGTCNIEGLRVKIKSNYKLSVGDYVEIQTETKSILKFAFIAYGIPLIIMIFSLLFAMQVLKNYTHREIIAVIIGLLSLIISSLILKGFDKRIEKSEEISYFIKRVL